jgi:hypothetical protein
MTAESWKCFSRRDIHPQTPTGKQFPRQLKLEKVKPNAENMRGLNLPAVKCPTVEVLPL